MGVFCFSLSLKSEQGSTLSQLWLNRTILTLVANSAYSVKMSAASATHQFGPGKVENLSLSPHPHPACVFRSHLLEHRQGRACRCCSLPCGYSREEAVLMSLCKRGRGAWSLWDSSSSRAGGVRREGQGPGSGPSPPSVQDDRWAILWAKSWQSACVGEWDAPAGACWKWDPGAACWTCCFNGQFCQTRLKRLQESSGQELMKPSAFSGLIKLCSGEMMHTKLSSGFFPCAVTTMAVLA